MESEHSGQVGCAAAPPLNTAEILLGTDSTELDVVRRWNTVEKKGLEAFCREDSRKFAKLLGRGVPHRLRWRAWSVLTAHRSSTSRRQKLVEDPNEPSQFSELIKIDIPRTFPEIKFFDKAAQNKLFKILNSYAIQNPKIGYCQGMNFVAGFILLMSNLNVEESYEVFSDIMNSYDLNGFFRENFPLLCRYIEVFDELTNENIPRLRAHFNREGIIPPMFLHQWLLTVFVTCLPLKTVAVVWDYFLSESLYVLLPLSITLLKVLQPFLLKMSFERSVRFLKSLRESGTQDEIRIGRLLVKQANKIVLSKSVLDRLINCDIDALAAEISESREGKPDNKPAAPNFESISQALLSSLPFRHLAAYPFAQYFQEPRAAAEMAVEGEDEDKEEIDSDENPLVVSRSVIGMRRYGRMEVVSKSPQKIGLLNQAEDRNKKYSSNAGGQTISPKPHPSNSHNTPMGNTPASQPSQRVLQVATSTGSKSDYNTNHLPALHRHRYKSLQSIQCSLQDDNTSCALQFPHPSSPLSAGGLYGPTTGNNAATSNNYIIDPTTVAYTSDRSHNIHFVSSPSPTKLSSHPSPCALSSTGILIDDNHRNECSYFPSLSPHLEPLATPSSFPLQPELQQKQSQLEPLLSFTPTHSSHNSSASPAHKSLLSSAANINIAIETAASDTLCSLRTLSFASPMGAPAVALATTAPYADFPTCQNERNSQHCSTSSASHFVSAPMPSCPSFSIPPGVSLDYTSRQQNPTNNFNYNFLQSGRNSTAQSPGTNGSMTCGTSTGDVDCHRHNRCHNFVVRPRDDSPGLSAAPSYCTTLPVSSLPIKAQHLGGNFGSKSLQHSSSDQYQNRQHVSDGFVESSVSKDLIIMDANSDFGDYIPELSSACPLQLDKPTNSSSPDNKISCNDISVTNKNSDGTIPTKQMKRKSRSSSNTPPEIERQLKMMSTISQQQSTGTASSRSRVPGGRLSLLSTFTTHDDIHENCQFDLLR